MQNSSSSTATTLYVVQDALKQLPQAIEEWSCEVSIKPETTKILQKARN
jgi:hypothetical protein